MAPKKKGGKDAAATAANPVKGAALTTDHAATLHPHGDGTATEVPNVSANGTYPPRPEVK
jgi:hypothetical protein